MMMMSITAMTTLLVKITIKGNGYCKDDDGVIAVITAHTDITLLVHVIALHYMTLFSGQESHKRN